MKTLKRFANIPSVFTLATFLVLTAGAAFADPPSRVVRLNYLSGEVSVQPGGVNDWVAAVMNRPLTTADRVWTDQNARAEMGLGGALLRLNAETSMTLTNVSDDIVQVELDQGTLNLHIRHLFDGETFELDTPNLAFTILKSGDYRFDVDPNADTTYVTVWNGEGEATGQGPGVKLHRGQQASFTNGTSLQSQVYDAPQRDGFDDWCQVRSEREDHAESYRYVSADVIGAEDLDNYGTWRPTPEYGNVWVPAVAPGWAPYHNGHWVWVAPWGWTWVDDAPWGFAPCHYGRWVFYNGFWGWSPGPPVVAVVRPVYAPALVAWVGGPRFVISVSFGGGGAVGWFPLGWGEPYVPAYAVSRNYFQQVNVTNTHITNITNVTNNYYINNNNTTTVINNNNVQNIHYANQNVAGAVTAVPQRTLTNSLPVARNSVRVSPGELKAASFTTTAPVAPQRTSVLGANTNKAAVAPPPAAVARTVVTRTAPPPKPIPFEAKQAELAKNPGRPLDAETEASIRQTIHEPAPAPKNGVAQPMHPGATETPTGMQAHPAGQPPKPGTPAQPAVASTPATPGHAVPRPPQPGTPSSTASQPKAARVYDESNMPTSPGNEPKTNNEPKTSATAPATQPRSVPRPPQAGGAKLTDPVYDRSSQSAHVQPASRSGSVFDRPAEPGEPHANVPRPSAPQPLYQPHPPHAELQPQSHSEPHPAASHSQQPHSEAPKPHNR
jgi:FecR protein